MNKLAIIALLSTMYTLTARADNVQEVYICTKENVEFDVTFIDEEQLICFTYDDIDDDYSEIVEKYDDLSEQTLTEHLEHINKVQHQLHQQS